MKIFSLGTPEETSSACANAIIQIVKKNGDAKICYATGKSVEMLYKKVVEYSQTQKIDFSNTKAYQLDEYYTNLENEELYMRNIVLDLSRKLNIKEKNQFVHKVTGKQKADVDYYRNVIPNKFDVMILGVGMNGHLAYNEPGSLRETDVHITDLDQLSINNTLGYGFSKSDTLPTRGITIGLKPIFESKRIILIALGSKKKEVMQRFLNCSNFDENFPVSILHNHSNVEIYTDFPLTK